MGRCIKNPYRGINGWPVFEIIGKDLFDLAINGADETPRGTRVYAPSEDAIERDRKLQRMLKKK